MIRSYKNKKIGIWGFGAVGKSALIFLSNQGAHCQVMDKRTLTYQEKVLIKQRGATYINEKNRADFFAQNSLIIPSPGVNVTQYKKEQFISELDIFACYWKKPVVAITGTVGKTTVTSMLATILSKAYEVVVGGNIGTPLLDLIDYQHHTDMAIVELSSWQLEHIKQFNPDIAVITNIYPNHLDRHLTFENYVQAKLNITRDQSSKNKLILPTQLKTYIKQDTTAAHTIWIDKDQKVPEHLQLSKNTFTQNWLYVSAVLQCLGVPTKLMQDINFNLEHRLEQLDTINTITFFNDSKSTTPASTLAAVKQLRNTKLLLILGGLSKGIDRQQLIAMLPLWVKHVVTFGAEAEQLKDMCETAGIAHAAFNDLPSAFSYTWHHAQPYDTILFSPAGSSFDLYQNYKKRGEHFKQLVCNLKQH